MYINEVLGLNLIFMFFVFFKTILVEEIQALIKQEVETLEEAKDTGLG